MSFDNFWYTWIDQIIPFISPCLFATWSAAKQQLLAMIKANRLPFGGQVVVAYHMKTPERLKIIQSFCCCSGDSCIKLPVEAAWQLPVWRCTLAREHRFGNLRWAHHCERRNGEGDGRRKNFVSFVSLVHRWQVEVATTSCTTMISLLCCGTAKLETVCYDRVGSERACYTGAGKRM